MEESIVYSRFLQRAILFGSGLIKISEVYQSKGSRTNLSQGVVAHPSESDGEQGYNTRKQQNVLNGGDPRPRGEGGRSD